MTDDYTDPPAAEDMAFMIAATRANLAAPLAPADPSTEDQVPDQALASDPPAADGPTEPPPPPDVPFHGGQNRDSFLPGWPQRGLSFHEWDELAASHPAPIVALARTLYNAPAPPVQEDNANAST